MEVQIFGIKKSADTRKALRFFAERRVKTHFVDLQERPASPGELKRFAQKFGVEALLDRQSRRFAELGLGAARLSDDRWLDKLAEEAATLRVGLVLGISSAAAADGSDDEVDPRPRPRTPPALFSGDRPLRRCRVPPAADWVQADLCCSWPGSGTFS